MLLVLTKYICADRNLKGTPNQNRTHQRIAHTALRVTIYILLTLITHGTRALSSILFRAYIKELITKMTALNYHVQTKQRAHYTYSKILTGPNKLCQHYISPRTASRRPRSKPPYLNLYWRKVKSQLKSYNSMQTAEATKPLQTWTLKLNISFKKNNRVYLSKRKREHLQLIKQNRLWIQNNSRFNLNSTYTTPPTANLLTLHNKLLLITYKNAPRLNSGGRYYKTHVLFKTLHNYKPQRRHAQNYHICPPRPSPLRRAKTLSITTYKINALKGATLYSQTTNIFTYVLVGLSMTQLPKANRSGHKLHALNGMFSFYNNNLSVNKLLVWRLNAFNALLKIHTPANIMDKNMLLVKTAHMNWRYFNYINFSTTPNDAQRQSITNYYPLFYFFSNNKQPKQPHRDLLFRLYYTHINPPTSLKYKNFYIFFLVNFLEKLLQKKLWVRADARDFFSPRWHKIIEKTTRNNIYIYRRFNRTIPIKELIEIIILMFTTRDLQIFYFLWKVVLKNPILKNTKKYYLFYLIFCEKTNQY